MSEEQKGNIIIYQSDNGNTKIDVRLENENVWLTQKMMAELFQTTPQNITIHLKNIFAEAELQEDSTCKDFLQVQLEGSRRVERKQKFYNLDVIIAVGYRIKSNIATNFRIWATERLKEYNINTNTVSHQQAIEKAKTEYKKYQTKTLSPVEKSYLENIKALQKRVDKKEGNDER